MSAIRLGRGALVAALLWSSACRQREEVPVAQKQTEASAHVAPSAPQAQTGTPADVPSAPQAQTATPATGAPSAPQGPPGTPAPSAPAPTAASVERGRYLAQNVLGCVACHSERDFTRYGGPLQGTPLAGACYGEEWGLPVRICAPNLTSDPEHGLGRWTDAELLRALREGRGRDGRVLFPWMPYPALRALSDDDTRALVAYLRTVPPVPRGVPRTELPADVAADIQDLAEPLTGPVAPPGDDAVERGRYLATVAQCAFCHTGGNPPAPFAGNRPAHTPLGKEWVPDLTPKGRTLRGLDEDAFVARFTAFRDLAPAPGRKGKVNKLAMPWVSFSGMHEEDLRAVYRYLRTLP
ncbi:c-type cytochrome [Pyxidicoccus parkwayensis]|uniref:C-type cytochrome n=1 Tax=Pyxidicoccus parkwayensis TaxID=2813578 RepID=A0ABX7NL06_9BACT|nr:c-type cytochrome [Pyxidicoccus parkwaysis]QSQ19547.1 c-type cytochrome [Pyxidicoccus parkwaysis]